MVTEVIKQNKKNQAIVKNIIMIAIIIGFAIIPLFMVKDGEFAGADYRAEKAINEIDESYKPWFSPIFEPKSGEVETFFFALQATIGAGVFGYGLGYMGGRKKKEKEANNDIH